LQDISAICEIDRNTRKAARRHGDISDVLTMAIRQADELVGGCCIKADVAFAYLRTLELNLSVLLLLAA